MRASLLALDRALTSVRSYDRDGRLRVAAVAMAHRIGEIFRGVVTGASEKGVYVRVIDPPFEGRVIQNEERLDVGDREGRKTLRDTEQLMRRLKANGWTPDESLHFERVEGGTHDEASWATRVRPMLSFLFPAE